MARLKWITSNKRRGCSVTMQHRLHYFRERRDDSFSDSLTSVFLFLTRPMSNRLSPAAQLRLKRISHKARIWPSRCLYSYTEEKKIFARPYNDPPPPFPDLVDSSKWPFLLLLTKLPDAITTVTVKGVTVGELLQAERVYLFSSEFHRYGCLHTSLNKLTVCPPPSP